MKKAVLTISVSAALCAANLSFAQIFGNPIQEERGDIVFRRINFPYFDIDDHPALFDDWFDSQTTDPGDGGNPYKHVIEMKGFTGMDGDYDCWGSSNNWVPLIVTSTKGITEITLAQFIDDAPVYYGSYRNFLATPQRGNNGAWGTRSGILQTANGLLARTGLINYVVNPGECVGLVRDRFMTASGSGATVDVRDVASMRSDAFVEFAYAANGLQNLDKYGTVISITNREHMNYVNSRAAHYTPRYLRGRLAKATIDIPRITLIDGVDEVTPITTGATSSSTIIVRVDDSFSGPGRLELLRASGGGAFFVANISPDTASHDYDASDIAELGNLQDSLYTLTTYDQAGNRASGAFRRDTTALASKIDDPTGADQGTSMDSAHCAVAWFDPPSGISWITWTGPSTNLTATFSCTEISTVAAFGPFCNLSAGTYTASAQSCSGVNGSHSVLVSTVPKVVFMTATSPGSTKTGQSSPSTAQLLNGKAQFYVESPTYVSYPEWEVRCAQSVVTVFGQTLPCSWGCRQGPWCYVYSVSDYVTPPPATSFTIHNSTNSDATYVGAIIRYKVMDQDGGNENTAQVTFSGGADYALTAGSSVSGSVVLPQVGQPYPTGSPDGVVVASPTIAEVDISSTDFQSSSWLSKLSKVLRSLVAPYTLRGSDIVFTSSIPISFTYQDPAGVTTDTSTLRIYRFDGVSWDSAPVTNQGASRSGSGIVIASGTIVRTGTYAAFYSGHDSSAPITTFYVQGSTHVFDGTVFVSTDGYAVLSSTDLVVDGFASQVATTYYRLDPTPSTEFSVYAGAIPLPLGPHVLEYRAKDYAGNWEPIKASTFIVTAGTVLKASGDYHVGGKLLAGFLDNGPDLDVESRAENDFTLAVSSPDRSFLLTVDNIGNLRLGGDGSAAARLDVGGGQDAAMQLRGGNNASSTASVQIAFGYNGTDTMRHAIVTRHGANAADDRIDFMLWNPAAGSGVGAVDALSLQGTGSMHVCPAGTPDVELEVSSEGVTGGGIIRVADSSQHSSRDLKTDIKELSMKDEERGYADVLALKPASFRYKRRTKDGALIDDARRPLMKGLIFEEAPKSVQGEHGAVILDERLVNVELALKAAMRRLEKLQKRLAELEGGAR